jgi:hypothetical protein
MMMLMNVSASWKVGMCGLGDQLSVSKDEQFSVKYIVNEKVLRHENVQEHSQHKLFIKGGIICV